MGWERMLMARMPPSAGGANVEYMYAFLGGKEINQAYTVFRAEDAEAADAVLAAKGIKTVGQDEPERL